MRQKGRTPHGHRIRRRTDPAHRAATVTHGPPIRQRCAPTVEDMAPADQGTVRIIERAYPRPHLSPIRCAAPLPAILITGFTGIDMRFKRWGAVSRTPHGVAGGRCAVLPDGRGRAQWRICDARDRSCGVSDVFRAAAAPFAAPLRICRTAAEIGRGIAAFSGRTGHADRIVAGRSGAAGLSGRGLRPRGGGGNRHFPIARSDSNPKPV